VLIPGGCLAGQGRTGTDAMKERAARSCRGPAGLSRPGELRRGCAAMVGANDA
jgi:hypothetical protein